MIIATSTCPSAVLAIFGLPGGAEWIILLVLGLLVFGRRLPEVGRNVGKSIVEFKKGIKGIDEEIDESTSRGGRGVDRPRELPRQEIKEPMDSRDESYATTTRKRDDE
jgi:sec-independent protein translocase protein TatA